MSAWQRLKNWAALIKRDVLAVWVAAKDQRTPGRARLIALFTAAYALSPIDLIPDFVPVLGMVDDIVLVPIGVWATVRLIPVVLMVEYRTTAENSPTPVSKSGAIVVICLWALLAGMIARAIGFF